MARFLQWRNPVSKKSARMASRFYRVE